GDGGGKVLGRDLAVDVAPVELMMAISGLDHCHGRVFRRRHGEGAGKLTQKIGRHCSSSQGYKVSYVRPFSACPHPRSRSSRSNRKRGPSRGKRRTPPI